MWVLGNEYMQEAAPWAVYKNNPSKAAHISRFSINLIRMYAILSEPFIPNSSKIIKEALGLEEDLEWPSNVDEEVLKLSGGQLFKVPELLFKKISDEEREVYKRKFSGM